MTKEKAKAILKKASSGEKLTEIERSQLIVAIKVISAIGPG